VGSGKAAFSQPAQPPVTHTVGRHEAMGLRFGVRNHNVVEEQEAAMRLVITENITLDGVVESNDGWFSPSGSESEMSDIQAKLQEMMQRQEALLLGRVTFEEFREFWPLQTDDTTGITNHLNRVRKYVVSRTLQDPAWENTTVLSNALVGEVRALKEQPGAELGVTGSITLCRALIEAGLVDEYRLFVYPIILGQGRRLFTEGIDKNKLKLVEAASFQSGIVLLTYTHR
jgi:dihydrofolate reductase